MSSKWLWGATLQPNGCKSTKPIIYVIKIIVAAIKDVNNNFNLK
jgi:hypothetical protein